MTVKQNSLAVASNPRPAGCMLPRMAMNAAQHKIINLLKTFLLLCCSSVFISVCVFSVWPKTTLLLPVWPRDAKRLGTPGTGWLQDARQSYEELY